MSRLLFDLMMCIVNLVMIETVDKGSEGPAADGAQRGGRCRHQSETGKGPSKE